MSSASQGKLVIYQFYAQWSDPCKRMENTSLHNQQICELVRFHLEDIVLKEAWTGPAALGLFPHALADVARLPVREVVSALHFKADLTLGLGTVAFDYMAK